MSALPPVPPSTAGSRRKRKLVVVRSSSAAGSAKDGASRPGSRAGGHKRKVVTVAHPMSATEITDSVAAALAAETEAAAAAAGPKRRADGSLLDHTFLGDAEDWEYMASQRSSLGGLRESGDVLKPGSPSAASSVGLPGSAAGEGMRTSSPGGISMSLTSLGFGADGTAGGSVSGVGAASAGTPLADGGPLAEAAADEMEKEEITRLLEARMQVSKAARAREREEREAHVKSLRIHERVLVGKEERAMARWRQQQKQWKAWKLRTASALKKDVSQLVMSRADEYREMQEEFEFVQNATPLHIKYGGEYWEMSLRGEGTRFVMVGNIFSGLFCPVTERKRVATEIIRDVHPKARVLSRASRKTWRDSKALGHRKKLIRKYLEELRPFVPTDDDVSHLQVRGVELFSWARDSVDRFYADKAVTRALDAVPEEKLDDPSTLAAVEVRMAGATIGDLIDTGDGDGKPLTSKPVVQPGPHLELAPLGEDTAAGGSSGDGDDDGAAADGSKPLALAFVGEAGATELCGLRAANCGTTALFYRWQRRPKAAAFSASRASSRSASAFSISDSSGTILPGDVHMFTFSFRSLQPGIFHDQWELTVTPTPLEFMAPVLVKLRGVATAADEGAVRRAALESRLQQQMMEHWVEDIVYSIIGRVDTPAPIPDFAENSAHKALFEEKNAHRRLWYSAPVYAAFHRLAGRVIEILRLPRAGATWDGSVDSIKSLIDRVALPDAREFGSPAAVLQRRLREDWKKLVERASVKPTTASFFFDIARSAVSQLVDAIPDESDAARRAAGLKPLFEPDPEDMRGPLSPRLPKSMRRSAGEAAEAASAAAAAAGADAAAIAAAAGKEEEGEKKEEVVKTPEESSHDDTLRRVKQQLSTAVYDFENWSAAAEADVRYSRLASSGMLLSNKQLADGVDLAGKDVLLRIDLQALVPKGSKAQTDLGKLPAGALDPLLPQLSGLMESEPNSLIIASHVGNVPKTKPKDPTPSFKPLVQQLKTALPGINVVFASSVRDLPKACAKNAGGIVLLENLATMPEEGFYIAEAAALAAAAAAEDAGLDSKEEEALERGRTAAEELADALSACVDIVINDAFDSSCMPLLSLHKLHPRDGIVVAGDAVTPPLTTLASVLEGKARPAVAIVGGRRLSSKLAMLDNLLGVLDSIVFGGAVALPLIRRVWEKEIPDLSFGKSFVDEELDEEQLAAFMCKAQRMGVQLLLPSDVVVGDTLPKEMGGPGKASAPYSGGVHTVEFDEVSAEQVVLDVGPQSREAFDLVILSAAAILWCGPLGLVEQEAFQVGTKDVMEMVKEAKEDGAFVVMAGEAMASMVEPLGATRHVDFCATGPTTAALLSGAPVPGLRALSEVVVDSQLLPITLADGETLQVSASGPEHGEPVLLLHGALMDGDSWKPLLPDLPGLRCLAPSLRAPREDSDYIATAVADCLALLTALELPQVHIVACGLGGQVAMALTEARPDAVGRLVLLNAPPRPASSTALRALAGQLDEAIAAGSDSEQLAAVFAPLLAASAPEAEELAAAAVQAAVSAPDAAAELLSVWLASDSTAQQAALSRLVRENSRPAIIQSQQAALFTAEQLAMGDGVAQLVTKLTCSSTIPFWEAPRQVALAVQNALSWRWKEKEDDE